jgi:hypothetical protein
VVDCTVEDISRSGMYLATDSPGFDAIEAANAPGTDARIELELPGDGPVQVHGSVVRVGEREGKRGIAIRIARDENARRPLANFMMRWAFWNRR